VIGVLKKLREKSNLFGRKLDKYQEAVTYAEAGLTNDAQRLFRAEQDNEDERPGKLLVVGRESHFSEESIKYALDMSRRLSYEIVALNSAPLSSETLDVTLSRSKVCSEFRKLSEENVKPFKEMAEKLSIPFTHVVKFSEMNRAVEEIIEEFKDVEFVVSDMEEERPAARAEQGERPRPQLYVYSMLK
jgi:hypothetical protein